MTPMTPTDPPVDLAPESPDTADVRRLIDRLDRELRERYPATSVHGADLATLVPPSGALIVARIAGRAVGCGALRLLDPGVGEIKRMYVEDAYRGRGIARHILRALETRAAELGCTEIWLETGSRQPEATHIYRTEGYTERPPYGEYVGDPHSICLGKRLGPE